MPLPLAQDEVGPGAAAGRGRGRNHEPRVNPQPQLLSGVCCEAWACPSQNMNDLDEGSSVAAHTAFSASQSWVLILALPHSPALRPWTYYLTFPNH